YALECWIAETRCLLVDTFNPITIDGFASPEATKCYNERLSKTRAEYVLQALLDAFGPSLTKKIFVTRGLGEEPALTSANPPLDNPPEDPDGLKSFMQKHADQVRRWPSWRRVEVKTSGRIFIWAYRVVVAPERPDTVRVLRELR